MKLDWQKNKGEVTELKDHRAVYFPGGFQLYVINHDYLWNSTKQWRVWWGGASNGNHAYRPSPPIKGLTDKWFKTRREAMEAAERIFVPMIEIAPKLFSVKTAVSAEAVIRRKRPT